MKTAARAMQNQPLRGVMFMCLGIGCLVLNNTVSKLATADFPTGQIVWARYIAQMALGVILLWPHRRDGAFWTDRPLLNLARAACQFGSNLLSVFGLAYIPLATVQSIIATAPLMVAALAVPVLGERMGLRRWTAVLVGFAGAVMILRPGMGMLHWSALAVFAAAVSTAWYTVLTRKLSGSDRAATTLFLTGAAGTLVLMAVLPFVWVMPDAHGWLLLAGVGAFSSLGHFFLILAFRTAEVGIVAPFFYVQVVFAGLLGLAVFGEVPDLWTCAGAAVIVASGLYVTERERKVKARG